MTVHAGLCRGNTGKAGRLYRGMAVTAINAHAAAVMRVAELNGLLPGDLRLRKIGGAIHLSSYPGQACNNE